MTEKQTNIATWISIAIILFGMASSAIAFTVTNRNKTIENHNKICKVETVSKTNEQRLNAHDVKISYIDEMKKDIKELRNQNTEILIALGRIEQKLESEK